MFIISTYQTNQFSFIMTLTKQIEDVKQYIIDQLDDNIGLEQDGSELHHET